MKRLNYPQDKKDIDFLLSPKRLSDVFFDETTEKVAGICRRVFTQGIKAVLDYTKAFDGAILDKGNFIVKKEEIEAAYQAVDKDFIRSLKMAAENIKRFHLRQRVRKKDWYKRKKGILLGEKYTPLERIGIYIPGGRVPLFSTVLMLGIPAKLARVGEMLMATPPRKDGSIAPHVLAAADLTGVDRIYKMGGAQAIAALARGTEMNLAVDKIVGPGNIYVTIAKRLVSKFVGIDFEAGPSEVMIVAEESSEAVFITADLLSQAEHDPLSSCILVTDSSGLIEAVEEEITRQLKDLSSKEVIGKVLESDSSGIILVNNIREAIELVNRKAPEHLELFLKDTKRWLKRVRNAGTIFLGSYSPTALGDYWAGPNHVLPTNGTARFSSPFSVDQFLKKSNVISYNRERLEKDSPEILRLIKAEGLDAHQAAVEIRLKKRGDRE